MRDVTQTTQQLNFRYKTYQYYLMALATVMQKSTGMHSNDSAEGMVKYLTGEESFRRIRVGGRHQHLVGQLLRSAWSSEMAVYAALDQEDEISASISIPWTFVQMYYCFHDLFEAVFLSLGSHQKQSQNHTAFLTRYSEFASSRKFVPEPWSALVSGDKADCSGLGFDPSKRINAQKWTNGTDSGERVYQLLRTTHEERMKESKTGSTSFLHFIYRLRTRTNYRDVDPYIFTLSERSIREEMGPSVRIIMGATMALGEALIAQSQGERPYSEMVGEVIKWVKRPCCSPIERRRSTILGQMN